MRIGLLVNGVERDTAVEPDENLLFTLRERLGLIGPKSACEEGRCGTCSVLVDGRLVCSCLIPAAEADGAEVTTVEGLADPGELHPVQRALLTVGAVQCGFCTPGMTISILDLLDRCEQPSEEEVRRQLAGNLCRCTGYGRILAAVERLW